MSLEHYLKISWVQTHAPSPEEIRKLLNVAEREIRDAGLAETAGLSPDSVFFHAYTGVLTLATIALHAAGYKVTKGQNNHLRTLDCLPLVLGDEVKELASYFDICRRKRNQGMYEETGITSAREAGELLGEARTLSDLIRAWLVRSHPHLSPETVRATGRRERP